MRQQEPGKCTTRLQERYTLARFQQRFAAGEAGLDYPEQVPGKGAAGHRCGGIGEPSRLARPRSRQYAICRSRHYPVHEQHLGKAIGAARVRTPRYQGAVAPNFS